MSSPAASAGSSSASAGSGSDAVTRQAGRGGLAVAGAKIYFILIGFVQQVALPHVVGAAGYGALSRALGLASIAYNPLVTTSIQGMSRAVAQSDAATEPGTIRLGYRVHAALAALAAVAFFLLAPVVAEQTGAPHVVATLRILGGVMLCYGLYAPLIGVLNGRRRFVGQAALDVLAATLRTIGLLAGGVALAGLAGGRVEGASAGFVAAATLVLVVAVGAVGVGRAGAASTTSARHVAFILPVLLGQVLLNLLLQADLQLVGLFASRAAEAAGRPPIDADPLVGAYRATQLFSFLPYQLLISVTFILFPMLAGAARDGDRAAMARYVRAGVRIALVLAGAMVGVTCGLPRPLLDLAFGGTGYGLLAADAMRILTLGFGAFAIFGILTTVLTSLGRERASMTLTALAFALVVVIASLLVPGTPFGSGILVRAAIGTSAGLLAATLAAAVLVRRAAGAVVAPLTLLRVAVALGVAVAVARFMPAGSRVMTLLAAAAAGASYLVVLVATRELGRSDIETLRTIARRR